MSLNEGMNETFNEHYIGHHPEVCTRDVITGSLFSCVTEFIEVRHVFQLLLYRWMSSRTLNVTWKKHTNRYFRSFEFENVVKMVSKFKIKNTN